MPQTLFQITVDLHLHNLPGPKNKYISQNSCYWLAFISLTVQMAVNIHSRLCVNIVMSQCSYRI